MGRKLRVGILFGGKSAEHEVSLQSAKNVYEAIDKDKYDVVLIGIDKAGKWYLNDASQYLLNADNPKLIKLNKGSDNLAFVPGDESNQLIQVPKQQSVGPIDVAFPVLHGTYGEDGTIQGLLKLANIPFVGAGVLGSAVGMDKDVTKRLLKEAGLPIPKFRVFHRSNKKEINFNKVVSEIGLPMFIKPANLGSSVGINKVHGKNDFQAFIEEAFKYDQKILIEEFIKGREIECSVLGNENPIASVPGEIVTDRQRHEFYSYDAKYIDEIGATLEAPAKLSEELTKKIQELAIKSFTTLCCEGMARVDFFLRDDNQIFLNEINTIPGFTKISMYPKLWELSGIPYSELIDKLIQLAIERFEKEKNLKTTFDL
ncbi:MAG: D-alanine--D-alanine ligase A [Ignavibacteria bacterium RBG_13_36_8]|nr:MAG: D-alanine--D-alanine ligase A [Ignavibacteria bacterium RBG_13_36_8]